MQAAPIPPHVLAFAPDFARRFGAITASVIAVIARLFLRNPRLAPLIVPLYKRLTRGAKCCDRLMARLARRRRRTAKRSGNETDISAATAPSDFGAHPTADSPGGQEPRNRSPRPKSPILTTEGFLIQTLSYEVTGFRSQLAHLLADPNTSELLAAIPTAAHFLRPICRLLGLPAYIALRRGDLGREAPDSSEPTDIPVATPPPDPGLRPAAKGPREQPPRKRVGPLPTSPPPRALADDLPWITVLPVKRA